MPIELTHPHPQTHTSRDLASHYLLHSSLELAEIAYLLGDEDTNSFVRAFSRREGVPPGRWREMRRETAAPVRVRAARPLVRQAVRT